MTEEIKKDAVATRELTEAIARRNVSESNWVTLCNSLYPGANPRSVLMVWDYCASRGLDPLKKPCHIVPMNVKDAVSGQYEWRDVIMPGIYEFRTTAHRTGEYMGHSKPEYGPMIEHKSVTVPEYCDMTIFRLVKGNRVEFPVRCYFREVVVLTKNGTVNDRWTRAPVQMMTKCTEAAGLREAFPEEIGGEHTEEEMSGRILNVTPASSDRSAPSAPTPSPFERLNEADREHISKAFDSCNFPQGLRLTKLNEFLGGEGVDPEVGAKDLLNYLRDEYAKQKTGQPRKVEGNGKKVAPPKADAGGAAGGNPPMDPIRKGPASPGTLQAPAPNPPQAPVIDVEPVSADEIFKQGFAPKAGGVSDPKKQESLKEALGF